MRYIAMRFSMLAAALLLVSCFALGEVRIHSLFQDNVVLQRDTMVPIWGTADPGEQITVKVGDQQASVTANSQGRWKVGIGPLKAGGPFEMTASGKSTITLHNVAVGEVWICSGQSNMEMAVKNSPQAWVGVLNAEQEVASADYPMIRHFAVKKSVAGRPQSDVEGKWVVASPETAGEFTAVGYFFGREIHKELGVPVGLIHTSWGGTPAESWTSAQALSGDPELASIPLDWEKKLAEYPGLLDNYKLQLGEWLGEAQKSEAAGKVPPQPPKFPADPYDNPWRSSGLYNAMLSPLIPFGIRGAIWYQGESNADRANQYRKLFPAMIQDWRRAWGQGDFPFLFVQLAGWENPLPRMNTWPELREAQTMALSLANTGMAVAIDIGDRYDIHPKNKQEVGRRLALAAEAVAYGKKIEYSGPVYDLMKTEGDRITLHFKHRGGGLVVRGRALVGFEIAGDSRKFFPADARMVGDAVVVSSSNEPRPVAVRYGWARYSECNLYNKAGLPASPFRTDDWPGLTVGER